MIEYFPQRGTKAYRLLLFFCSLKDYGTIDDIKNFNPSSFPKRYYFYKLTDNLCEHGYLERGENNSFRITPKGIAYINTYDRIHIYAKK